MAAQHGSVTAHPSQSLPSFAQTFGQHHLPSMPSGSTLPPIQSRMSMPMDNRRVNSPPVQSRSRPSSEDSDTRSQAVAGKKRSHHDITSNTRDEDRSSDGASPRIVHVKEEQDHDMLDPSPPPDKLLEHRIAQESEGAPSPSSTMPAKKRRVTVSGPPHPLNTDVRPPVDQASSTPISPVVMGFTIQRDNPSAVEQVKSMINVKHKQKALIEQRRGSVAGITSSAISPVPAPAALRPTRRSPNNGTGGRRPPAQGSANVRPPSPTPVGLPNQPPMHYPTAQPPPHSLPPPSISFAKRRAGLMGGKKKPADIVISPRDAQTPDQLAPVIQSAPPVQGSFYTGKFSMALPRLPSAMGGGDNVRRVASNVPPTPTRLSMMSTSVPVSQAVPGASVRSPPAASVPIASTRVPPTPSSLQHPGYSGDKSAFLAPFEMFYDALNDSKQLKNWLGEQLHRSNTLMQSLTQQQEKLNETVDVLVEKKVSGIRSEMNSLQRRVEELEDALRSATSGRRHSIDDGKGKQPVRNGVLSGPIAPETYTFPPVVPADNQRLRPDPIRRQSSPGWGQDRDARGGQQHAVDSDTGSPAPFDSRRLSVSATRLDPMRSHSHASEIPQRVSVQSPPQVYRDGVSHSHPAPTPSTVGKRSSHDRPALSRQASFSSTPGGEQSESPASRHAESRMDSTLDARGEES